MPDLYTPDGFDEPIRQIDGLCGTEAGIRWIFNNREHPGNELRVLRFYAPDPYDVREGVPNGFLVLELTTVADRPAVRLRNKNTGESVRVDIIGDGVATIIDGTLTEYEFQRLAGSILVVPNRPTPVPPFER